MIQIDTAVNRNYLMLKTTMASRDKARTHVNATANVKAI